MRRNDRADADKRKNLLVRLLRRLREPGRLPLPTDTHDWDTKQEILRNINDRHSPGK